MSLLDEVMLPRLRRKIPQVHDLLQAEDQSILVMVDFLKYLADREILLRAEVMNKPNLQRKIKQITGLDCEILEESEALSLKLRYYKDSETSEFAFREKILEYVPAHLSVIMEYLQRYSGSVSWYAGTVCAEIQRYVARPAEMNKKVSKESVSGIGEGAFKYVKMMCYPSQVAT